MKTNYNLWMKDNQKFKLIATTKKTFNLNEKISYCKRIIKRWEMEMILINTNAFYEHKMIRRGNIIMTETPLGKAWYQAL